MVQVMVSKLHVVLLSFGEMPELETLGNVVSKGYEREVDDIVVSALRCGFVLEIFLSSPQPSFRDRPFSPTKARCLFGLLPQVSILVLNPPVAPATPTQNSAYVMQESMVCLHCCQLGRCDGKCRLKSQV